MIFLLDVVDDFVDEDYIVRCLARFMDVFISSRARKLGGNSGETRGRGVGGFTICEVLYFRGIYAVHPRCDR